MLAGVFQALKKIGGRQDRTEEVEKVRIISRRL
jgi:hypothetical protein